MFQPEAECKKLRPLSLTSRTGPQCVITRRQLPSPYHSFDSDPEINNKSKKDNRMDTKKIKEGAKEGKNSRKSKKKKRIKKRDINGVHKLVSNLTTCQNSSFPVGFIKGDGVKKINSLHAPKVKFRNKNYRSLSWFLTCKHAVERYQISGLKKKTQGKKLQNFMMKFKQDIQQFFSNKLSETNTIITKTPNNAKKNNPNIEIKVNQKRKLKLKPYQPKEKTVSSVCDKMSSLFSVSIQKKTDAPTWDRKDTPDVYSKYFNVENKEKLDSPTGHSQSQCKMNPVDNNEGKGYAGSMDRLNMHGGFNNGCNDLNLLKKEFSTKNKYGCHASSLLSSYDRETGCDIYKYSLVDESREFGLLKQDLLPSSNISSKPKSQPVIQANKQLPLNKENQHENHWSSLSMKPISTSNFSTNEPPVDSQNVRNKQDILFGQNIPTLWQGERTNSSNSFFPQKFSANQKTYTISPSQVLNSASAFGTYSTTFSTPPCFSVTRLPTPPVLFNPMGNHNVGSLACQDALLTHSNRSFARLDSENQAYVHPAHAVMNYNNPVMLNNYMYSHRANAMNYYQRLELNSGFNQGCMLQASLENMIRKLLDLDNAHSSFNSRF